MQSIFGTLYPAICQHVIDQTCHNAKQKKRNAHLWYNVGRIQMRRTLERTVCYPSQNTALPSHSTRPALWGIRSMFHPLLWKKYFGHTPVAAGCEELCLFALQVICSPTAAKNPFQCYILRLSKQLKVCYLLFYEKHKHLWSFWFREQFACI